MTLGRKLWSFGVTPLETEAQRGPESLEIWEHSDINRAT